MTESLIRSLVIQKRVIGALLRREMLTRYGRNNIGFLWLFVEPMLFTLIITIFWSISKTRFPLPLIAFSVTGYPIAMIWRNSVSRGKNAIEPNSALLFHRNVKVFDIFVARLLLEVLGTIASFVFLVLAFMFSGLLQPPDDLLKVISGILFMAWFGFALALVIGGLAERSEVVGRIWSPISFLLFIGSGVFTLVDWLPPAARQVMLWLPMVHVTEMIRDGYFGRLFNAYYDIAYIFFWNLFLTLYGLALVRQAGQKVELQ